MNKILKFAGLLAGCAVLGATAASAQDKATLDFLVKNHVITQADADAAAKTSTAPVTVTPNNALVKGLKIEGRIHIQYDWLSTEDKASGASNPPSTNQFFIRRAYLGAVANMGNGWGGQIVIDFAAGAGLPGGDQGAALGATGGARLLFDKVVVYKDVDTYGRATAGYQKVTFNLEEYTSSANIKAVERSIMTRFFAEQYGTATNGRIGFSSRHVGLYWDGKVADLPGFTYGAALTNGIQSTTSFSATGTTGGFNKFAGWGYLAYTANATTDLNYAVGVNVGYSADGNSNSGPGATAASNGVFGYNPWFRLTYMKNAELTAEFAQTQITDGRTNAVTGLSKAQPYGFNITPSYKINDEWELAARYSYINTNGRGVTINNLYRNAPNVLGAATSFNSAQAIYVGVNWYIVGNAVKLSAGYEWAEFMNRGSAAGSQSFTGSRANVSGFRTRLQLLF